MSTVTTRTISARRAREEIRAQIIAAATELIRERSYAALSVGAIMNRAGIGRTLFYRHFDDLADLLTRACREAIEELYLAEVELADSHEADVPRAIRGAISAAVGVYRRHGPLLRALAEGAAVDPRIAAGETEIRLRFDELVAQALRGLPPAVGRPLADPGETAHALNLLNTAYLLDAFGHEPRVSEEIAIVTLTEIWLATIRRGEG